MFFRRPQKYLSPKDGTHVNYTTNVYIAQNVRHIFSGTYF